MPWPSDFPTPSSKLISAFRTDFNSIIESMLGTFIGASEPTALYAGMIWSDTGTGYVKQRNSLNTSWEILRKLGEDWGGMLARTGGGMTGSIDMNSNQILNLPLGSGNAPARYADLAAYAKLDGSIAFTGIPSGPAQDPSSANQFARKSYVDAKALAGGAFTAQITLPQSAAAGSTQAVRQVEMESMRDGHTHSGAVGAGTRIKVTDLITTGVAANKIPVADGAGNPVVMKELKTSPIQIFADPPSVWSGNETSGWATVDLSSQFGQGSYAVILSVNVVVASLGASGANVTVEARSNGTTPTTPQKLLAATDTLKDTRSFFFVTIDPTARTFDLRVIQSLAPTNTTTVRLIAHVQIPAL